jgi:hypothetical protein
VLFVVPIAALHFNWIALLNSFGFKTKYARHPFQIVVLIMGGALTPVFHALSTLILAIQYYFERKAGKSISPHWVISHLVQ